MKNGVPYDVAFSLEHDMAMAFGIIFGELDGGEWDFNSRRWKDQK